APLLGTTPLAAPSQAALAGHRVHLQRGYRQADSLDLAPLSAAVRAGDADAALALLRGGTLAGVTWHPDLDDPLSGPTRTTLLDAWRAVATASDPRAALQQAARARLLLLGDRDQLPSIEAGDVLAAMSDAALGDGNDAVDALPPELAHRLAPLLGTTPLAAPSQAALAGHRVHLQRGYRQADSLDLAPLSAAVRAGDADAALALLRGGTLAGVTWHPDLDDPLSGPTRTALLDVWRAVATASDPRAALQQAARARLLTAVREGPQGAVALNARIEEALAGVRREPYFHGRLLLVQQNDYRQQLFNGDIGVCWRDADGEIAVWFADGSDDGVRRVHPSALPAHDSAFAMTVHKAQGSEFDDVWLLLPRHDVRTLSRELLYTAMTRARRSLHVCANEDAVRAALARHVVRVSGLRERLSVILAPRSST
ncbi:MAG TPA: ATP-binding domain-containing protein, partial [Luteimonas sp.]|nr:ATP-binding domain-containing protein [Luteimonas sp.]